MIRLAMTLLAAAPLLTALPAFARERPPARQTQRLYTPPAGVTLMPLPPLTRRPGMTRPDETPVADATRVATPGTTPETGKNTRNWLSGR